MPAGVPAFLQIMQVRNVGADGGGNSVSGSKASSAYAFPAQINRNSRKRMGCCFFREKGSARSS